VYGLEQQILRTDASGMPLEWIDFREVVRLHCLGLVAYAWGSPLFELRGGINARTRQRSTIEVNSIVATRGPRHAVEKLRAGYLPPLNNPALFRRDDHLCLYCGEHFPARRLSRDHVRPLSRGGKDHWSNVVTACLRCNGHKAGRTPEQAGMELLAIPFVPTHAEYIFLQGRNVLADQMAFLRAHFPRTSPLHGRLPRN
jgi:5-methylcytosine-specific restriction endonuclease McrA